jgi:hypothetical protein
MFVQKNYQNISMWSFVLKSLLPGIRWCNRILIMTLGLGDMTFLPQKHEVYVDASNFGF